jgi:hypothetical protein
MSLFPIKGKGVKTVFITLTANYFLVFKAEVRGRPRQRPWIIIGKETGKPDMDTVAPLPHQLYTYEMTVNQDFVI